MFVTPAYAQGVGATPDVFISILPFVLIFVIMYFLIIRPQRTQMKKRGEMLAAIRRGDTVVTGGGFVMGSAVLVGTVGVMQFIASLVLSPWAGALTDRLDRAVHVDPGRGHTVAEYKDKKFKSVTRGGADLSRIKAENEPEKPEEEKPAENDLGSLLAALKLTLADAVKDVRFVEMAGKAFSADGVELIGRSSIGHAPLRCTIDTDSRRDAHASGSGRSSGPV